MPVGCCEHWNCGDGIVILVTVGTSDFDQLVERMDQLAPSMEHQVFLQIGNGRYVPQHCDYVRFAPSLDPYYEQADLVVAHGGLGTTMEVLLRGIRLISVQNTTCIDDHQNDILDALSQQGHLVWCRDLDELPHLLKTVPATELKPYHSPPCTISDVIKGFLDKLE